MAYNKVTVDVEARFVDNVTSGVKTADRAVTDLTKKKRKVTLDADDEASPKIKKAGKEADNFGKKNPTATLDAEDKASSKITKAMDKARSFANRIYEGTMKLKDNGTLEKVEKVSSALGKIAGTPWTATLKIKDFALTPLKTVEQKLFSIKTLIGGLIAGATANKFVKQPVQMYADYEDLVTQFGVLLGSKDAAQKRIDELTTFAGQTPFTRDEIYQASRVLQTYTQGALATPDATGGLRMIGDIAAATGSEYTQVAGYMGRLYNEVKRGGESMGEPLAYLREMGALSAEQEKKIKEIATGSGTIETKWAEIAKQFSSTDGMMLEMSNQMNNLMLGVKSFFKNNVFMKLGAGISESLKPFLIDFRTWRSENKELIAGWASDIQNFAKEVSGKVLDVFRKIGTRASRIMKSSDYQNADFFGKIGMLWKGAISNPFKDWLDKTVKPWWENTFKPWAAEKAQKLGETIGTGLSNALLTVLGFSDKIVSGGASVAGGFMKGFLKGFDASAVVEAIGGAIKRAFESLPWWGKLIFAGLGINKVANMFSKITGAFKNVTSVLFGGTGTNAAGETVQTLGLFGNLKKFIGSTGNSQVQGSGLLNFLANTGYKLTGGSATAGGYFGLTGMSGAKAAALGGVGIAGGAVGAYAAGSGLHDMYKASTDSNLGATMSGAYARSGAMKLGGVGAGALAGMAIGGPLGALIGAGIGGIAGLITGKAFKKEAARNMSFAELEQAAQSSEEAMEELEKRQNRIYKGMEKTLGNITLSYKEVQTVVSSIFSDVSEGLTQFNSAQQGAANAINSMESANQEMKKWLWKSGLGQQFTDEDKQSFLSSVETYISNGEKAVEAQHYEFTAAVGVLLDPKSESSKQIIKSMDDYYTTVQKELDDNSEELKLKMNAALEDGTITGDEQEIIDSLIEKRNEIIAKVNAAESSAGFEAIKIKFSAEDALDQETWDEISTEISEQLEANKDKLTEANVTVLTGLKLQLDNGAISQDEYDKQVQEITEGTQAQLDSLDAKANDLQIEIAADALEKKGILGEDAIELINESLTSSLKDGINPIDWTPDDIQKYFGVEVDDETAAAMGKMISEPFNRMFSEEAQTMAAEAKKEADQALTVQFASGSSIPMPVDVMVMPTYHIGASAGGATLELLGQGNARGGLAGANIPGYSNGGMVRGGAQLITVAEEGSPEMIIPMSSQRRGRALSLWAKAGNMLGVPGFARGGMTDGSADQGIRYQQYGGTGAAPGSQNVQVDVGGVTVAVNVEGADGNVAEAIRAQGGEIADTIAGILADAFNSQFANTPVRGTA